MEPSHLCEITWGTRYTRHMLGYQSQTQIMTLKRGDLKMNKILSTKGSQLTVTRNEALDPQYNVQQKDHDKRSVKNIPHLTQWA